LLAPLALVVCAVALFTVINSGGRDSSDSAGGSARPEATATATPKSGKSKPKARTKTYTVRAGDTPSAIAERAGVGLSELLDANPNADPNALSPGQKLKLP
jgi:LysM repeat protein